jgi:lysophospholipase L1-like esterase
MRLGTKALAQFAASCALVFCTVEALARIGFTLQSDLAQLQSRSNGPALAIRYSYAAAWFRYSPVLGWERRPGFKGKSDDDIDREFDGQGFFEVDSRNAAEPASNKVLFIGDSNTFGFGVPTAAGFAEYVERILPGVRTVNLGVTGYTSYQGRKALERYLSQIHPAVVVASFNWNDRRAVSAGDEDGPAHFEKVYEASRRSIGRVNAALGYLYSYRGLGAVMRRLGLLATSDVIREPVDKLRPRVDEMQYRENLAAIAGLTSRAGIPLVFVLLRDNPLQSGLLNRGIDRLAGSQIEAAIEDFKALVRANGPDADLARIYLARAYRAVGRTREADEVLLPGDETIYLLGGHPIRLDRDYNAIMREVAEKYKVDVVDAASALESDPYDYIDACHFDSGGHRKVAELLAADLANLMKPERVGVLR